MNNAPLLFSLLFFIVFGIYSFGGFYIILSNPKVIINRVFFAIFISLGLWCLGYSFVIFNSYLDLTLSQVVPVILFIPLSIIFVFIKRPELLNVKSIRIMQLTINDSIRSRIYNFITAALIAGGFLNVVTRLPLNKTIFMSAIKLSLFLFFLGLLIQVIQHIGFTDEIKDNFILTLISLSIPFITLQFIEFASITIWAFPFVLIIIFTMFNNRKMLIVLSASILLTQASVWVLTPVATVMVDNSDHFVRIMLYCFAIALAFYVNNIYMFKLKENSDQILIQKNIAEISTDFVTVGPSNIDEKINKMLKKLGELFCIDRAHLFLFDLEKNTSKCSYSWCTLECDFENESLQNVPLLMFPWMVAQFSKNDGLVHISDVELMPAEADIEKCALLRRNVKSIISIPLLGDHKPKGFLGFVSVKSKRKWDEDHINTLKIMSNLAAEALSKVKSEEKQRYMAYYDQLTSLPNRTLFKDILSEVINMAGHNGKIIGIMLLDLDSFKNVNDTLGHESGDILLQMVAVKLKQIVHKLDTVARFGGDEFLILINNISTTKDIERVAHNILSMFSQPFNINGQDFFITGSAGIAVYPMDGSDADTLIKNTDIALYSAKGNGKNQYQMCTSNMKYEVQNAMELTNSLYRVQERDELVIYYQPQVDIESEKIVGLEALLRWNHPRLGRISPNIFIPLAEKTGLINPIGEWVMRTACFQNKAWQDIGLPPVRMGVNLSFVQFKSTNIVDMVTGILKETGMSPEYLDLEITESTVVYETAFIDDALKKLKELGVSISIDDFGTDYSSLSRLKQLPFDRIKMDMQFVHGIDESEKDQAYATLIINLAKNLGLKLIAEGVDTFSQLQFLKHKSCDEIQGFYFYKPMPDNKIEALLRSKYKEIL